MNFFTFFAPQVMAASEVSDASTMGGLLKLATEFVTWVLSAMTSFLDWIVDNPVVLVLFIIGLAGSAIGFLMRIWRSV